MNDGFAKSAYRHFVFWGILTSLAMTVCTIVDALLIGNLVGSDGLAASNLSTPVFLFYALLGIMLGMGGSVRIGRALGAADIAEANRLFRGLLSFALLFGALCWIPLLFRNAFFRFLGVTEALFPLTNRYLTVVICCAPLFVLYHVLSASVRTDGDPRLAAIASAVVICVNLLLDLLFMLVFRWGIIGASVSLCVAEALGVLTLLRHFWKKQALLRFSPAIPKLSDLIALAASGFGLGSAYIFQAVVMLVFNKLLTAFSGGEAAVNVAIFGVIYTTGMIPFAVYDGASNALSTVTAFFLGESDIDGVECVAKRALTVSLGFGVVITAVCFLLSEQIARFFGLPPEIASGSAASAIRLFSFSIFFTAVNSVATAFWQSIGRSALAGAMSLLRNFALLLLLGAYFIPDLTIRGVSLAYIYTEAFCSVFVLAILLFSGSRRRLKQSCVPSGRVFENQYTISADSMEQITGDLERIGREWDIPIKTAYTVNFICEELLLNIIKFGLENEKKEPYISIRLMEQNGSYVLRIRDNVRSYNPFESDGDAIDNGVLAFIRKKTKHYTYQRKMMFNYLYMVI